MVKHTVCEGGGENAVLLCTHCGERIPFPYGAIPWVAGVLQAFERAHEHCEPGERHDEPLARMAGQEG
jgi:hypothetical protein